MAFKKKAEEMEKENLELATQLAKKEAELDVKTQEKEDVEANLERTKEKLETEVARHNELKQRLSESDGKFPSSIDIKSIPKSSPIPAAPAPPAPPPPMAPPAPPPPLGKPAPAKTASQKRNVPASSNPLKSFNWSKLPECKVDGTIWTDIDETRLYKALDLAEVDKLFSAYQKNGSLSIEGSIEDLRSLGTMGRRTRVISVIDSRRAQNCTILLSKLKMSNEEITKAIMR